MIEQNSHKLQKWQIWLPLLLSLSIAGGILAGLKMKDDKPSLVIHDQHTQKALKMLGYGRMEELIRYIDAKYVDEVEDEKLVKSAIDHLLDQLDPHSTYITREQIKQVNEQLQGNFDGIGIEFMMLEDTILVVTPLAGGPSEEAGIHAGDKIIAVGDSVVAGNNLSSEDVAHYLRGEEGSTVELGILRGKEQELRHFEVKRGKIPTNSLDVAYMLNDETGYFKINRFSATTFEEFMRALEDKVENKGMKNLVLDLRQNPGGYLQEATKLLSQFFKERDKLLVYTEGRSFRRTEYESTGRNYYDIEDIAILIDGGSASASEIVAGAIQDWDRGVIIGRRSFGKGLVQEQYKLSDGSALRLTVARYYTPSGRSIQRDYNDLEDYENDFYHRYITGELQDEDLVEIQDSLKFYTAGGRVVYGGGGIMPDIFVPLDTTIFSKTYVALRQHIPTYIFRYYESEKDRLEAMDEEDFFEKFTFENKSFDEFLEYAQSKSTSIDKRELNRVDDAVRLLMKARLAKHLYGDTAFYKVYNSTDQMIKEALQSISNSNPLVERKTRK